MKARPSKNSSKRPKPTPATPKKTTDQELADLLLKRNAERELRLKRAGSAIESILEAEKLTLAVSELKLVDGRLLPVIQLQDRRE